MSLRTQLLGAYLLGALAHTLPSVRQTIVLGIDAATAPAKPVRRPDLRADLAADAHDVERLRLAELRRAAKLARQAKGMA